MGIGTTALGCIETGRNYIGFEISENQCNYFEEKKWDDDLWENMKKYYQP